MKLSRVCLVTMLGLALLPAACAPASTPTGPQPPVTATTDELAAIPGQPLPTAITTELPLTAIPEQAQRPLYPGPGDYVRGLVSSEIMRWFKLHIPESYQPGTPVPLVLDYHGAGSNFHEEELLTQMSALADREGFIVAYPQASGWEAYWLGITTDPIDVQFARDLLDHLENHLSIDPARIYATGFSSGAGMAEQTACYLSDRIAAAGPVAGRLYTTPCDPGRPVPIAGFFGTDDPIMPYVEEFEGTIYSMPDWAQAWAERNGCDPAPTIHYEQDDVVGQTWGNCDQSADVNLYTVQGGGHSWPGSRYGMAFQYPDATAILWEFFQTHPMPAEEGQASRPASPIPEPLHARLDLGGYWLYITCQGEGSPTVILESAEGTEANSRPWGILLDEIGQLTRVCTYDRPGIGWSDPSLTQPHTAQDVADELHLLLQYAGEEPPFVLVAHSLGGYFARLFAATYPQDVVGMVLVDTWTEDYPQAFSEIMTAEEYAAFLEQVPSGLRIDLDRSQAELRAITTSGDPPYGDLPLVVIARGLQLPDPDLTTEQLRARLERWQELQAGLTRLSNNGTLIIAQESSHWVQSDQPELIIYIIREILDNE